jgi:hypothetical protein
VAALRAGGGRGLRDRPEAARSLDLFARAQACDLGGMGFGVRLPIRVSRDRFAGAQAYDLGGMGFGVGCRCMDPSRDATKYLSSGVRRIEMQRCIRLLNIISSHNGICALISPNDSIDLFFSNGPGDPQVPNEVGLTSFCHYFFSHRIFYGINILKLASYLVVCAASKHRANLSSILIGYCNASFIKAPAL